MGGEGPGSLIALGKEADLVRRVLLYCYCTPLPLSRPFAVPLQLVPSKWVKSCNGLCRLQRACVACVFVYCISHTVVQDKDNGPKQAICSI